MLSYNVEEIWNRILESLSSLVNRQSFETWLKPIKPISIDNLILTVEVPNSFFVNWLEEHYKNMIVDSIKHILREDFKLEILSSQSMPKRISQIHHPQQPNFYSNKDNLNNECKLNPRYTFDTFIVGPNNSFAHAAALAVAENPGTSYNPLFIYGGVGLGKTHIMQAIGNEISKVKNSFKLFYISAENFMNEMVYALKKSQILSFKNKYRGMDLLLIDDIHFLAGKEGTQEEFFHTFNTLYEARKQIVITSDRPPKEIPALEERLVSRFEWGLISDIQPAPLETRIAILRKKSEIDGIDLPDDVTMYIANNITSNIRELEGSLIRLLAYSSLTGKEITLPLTQHILKDTIRKPEQTLSVSVKKIQEVVCDYYNIEIPELIGKKRTINLAFPRQIAMYLTRNMTNLSLTEIGKYFSGKDHTTIIHACEKIKNRMNEDPDLVSKINYLKNSILDGKKL